MAYWEDKFKAILSVYLILENDQGEVLLLLRENTGFCDGQLGLPAGHVDGGETLHAAMCREAKEEVGLQLRAE
ncbi:MAG: NUDIX domain-containing protein, partial [Candidatus Magasanikbacteria bacterium]|nr:NUDIX domain-containing protein [Candidatus Magasanikbacteria bacterium]